MNHDLPIKAFSFGISLLSGVLLAGLFSAAFAPFNLEKDAVPPPRNLDLCFKSKLHFSGSGTSSCGISRPELTELSPIRGLSKSGTVEPFRVISKQKPSHTESAREKGIEGTVTLRVTFLASGQIGSISVINGLPDGLTEKAIEAARKIKFEPKRVNGVPQSTSRKVIYRFDIY